MEKLRQAELDAIKAKRIVFIIDEAHRSQFGVMHERVKKTFCNALFFGFTGTPIFAENMKEGELTTETVFGKCLAIYSLATGIRDGNVLGFWPEAVKTYEDKLKDGYRVIGRLTDGVNVTSGYATCNINNSAKETYTEQELAEETTREDYDILGISVGTNELRLQIEEEQENAVTYNYYYKTINEEEYKLISTSTNYNDPAVIRDVEEGAIYKIKVLVVDESGNVTRSENTATMIALGEAEKDQTYTNNRTYIDDSKENIKVAKNRGWNTCISIRCFRCFRIFYFSKI